MRRIIFIAIAFEIVTFSAVIFFQIKTTHAGTLYNISDTLSNSTPASPAVHTISYLSNSPVAAGKTIKITFDPDTNAFGGIQNVAMSDIQFTGATLVGSCSGISDQVTLSTSTAPGDNSIIFTVCPSNTVASGTKTIAIGNSKIINPSGIQSYVIRLGGTMPDGGDTRVVILTAIKTQASVATNFAFSIGGVATNTAINGVTTTGATASTNMAFSTLSPNSPEVLGQTLSVTTNAPNGFSVTVHEDQDLTSGNGNTIHLFKDGNATTTPSSWVAPLGIAGETNTYGHIGVTTDDATLDGGAFVGAKFAGGFQSTSSLVVFSFTGPADGSTQNIGMVSVAYQIEISPLQAAGSDYTNNLIYVATPMF